MLAAFAVWCELCAAVAAGCVLRQAQLVAAGCGVFALMRLSSGYGVAWNQSARRRPLRAEQARAAVPRASRANRRGLAPRTSGVPRAGPGQTAALRPGRRSGSAGRSPRTRGLRTMTGEGKAAQVIAAQLLAAAVT